MVKKRVKRSSGISFNGIGGWLLFMLALFTAGFVQMILLIFPRLKALISYGIAQYPGVFVSLILITIYAVLLGCSVVFILQKKALAKRTSIYAMIIGIAFNLWINLVGVLIFYGFDVRMLINGAISILINLVIAILVISYFLKSKRVKSTLTGK